MGFIISESGFEMTPGSREIDTPGIWRQDERISTVGDAFSSSFAAALESVDPKTDAQRNARLQKSADRIGNRITRANKGQPSLTVGGKQVVIPTTRGINLAKKRKKILGKKI